MRVFTILIIFFISASNIAQTQIEDENQDENQNHLEVVEPTKEELKAERKLFADLAEQRTILLQQELNLSNYTSNRIKRVIIKYSIQANKVIQSNASEKEKTKDLSNIVYFQNEEFKKVLTVHQFYKYLKLTDI
ncbi:hypothetical protein D1815_12335 [Aquimarina sp. AD1]|uniref:hypothetical protein n=1 Tax=Aquimarina TaxID=290174 RepID=UPI00041EC6A6|nr:MULTISPECIES: hypothetical protein [Aquimarina]AXT56514.1 hypothetical protein D1815_12335 [Aquimarina sp. AD1]RKN34252.1 hypothetical protein D7035_04690 [Aquimarina sp. AD1]